MSNLLSLFNMRKKYYSCFVYCGAIGCFSNITTYNELNIKIAEKQVTLTELSITSQGDELIKLINQLQNHIGEGIRLIDACNGYFEGFEGFPRSYNWSIVLNFVSDKNFRILDGICIDSPYIDIMFVDGLPSHGKYKIYRVYYSDN